MGSKKKQSIIWSSVSLYNNLNQSGVYPFGCDSCVGITKQTPYCVGHKPYAQPQSKNICNIQRNATSFGGTVYLKFAGFCKKEKLNYIALKNSPI